ncbi:MAG: hypothetical protein RL336_639, partial [Pseudomonadota bacterium]
DATGGLDEAMAAAAELAELEDYEAQWIRPEMTFFEAFTQALEVKQGDVVQAMLGRLGQHWAALQTPYLLLDPRDQFALCTDCATP